MHKGFADRSGEVICQGQHLLQTDLFEGVNLQSVAHASVRVCMCVCGLGKLTGPRLRHSCLAASLRFFN